MLRLNQVVKQFAQPDGDVTVLNGATFHLPAGRSAALLGESGSGKSTLLHLVAGLDSPDAGELTIDGRSSLTMTNNDWNRLRRDRLSLIFQQYHLVPTLTVLDNLQLQARLSQRLDAAFRDHLVDRLGLGGLTKRLPHQLSGGQQQRVAIARALLHRPALVLADEPTGNLDEDTSERVMNVLVDLVRETGSSLLMVTHSAHMAGFLDEQWRLQHGRLNQLEVPAL
ncbi:ABC transporter ATP-binding protein [Saccharospirillum sp.]|uniref:ABC transporter ATP-binding protein n=1 Tax=Saccharospirillum sp. TaxID=2033801 RepID=UPI0034A093F3